MTALQFIFRAFTALVTMTFLSGCMKDSFPGQGSPDVLPEAGSGLFILCEGNYNAGNSSLTFYDTGEKKAYDNVFSGANDGQKLGDTGQSMTMHGGSLWAVVNASHVVFAIDPHTFREKGRIVSSDMTSPRFIHFVSDSKAYISQLYDSRILIADPGTFRVTGSIDTGMEQGTASVEQMVQYGDYVLANCWSYQKTIIKIDSRTDEIVQKLEVGVQPQSICMDSENRLWVLTDGGAWLENPAGYEAPRLVCVDPDAFTVEKTFYFALGDSPSELQAGPDGNELYFLNNGKVWKMPVSADSLPDSPFIDPGDGTWPYAMTVCPWNSDVYVADAIDYVQNGAVTRYSADGKAVDEFRTGVCPGSFCWF